MSRYDDSEEHMTENSNVPFNNLSPAEAERLAVLIEEMAEAIQAACKILRHGYENSHPDGGQTNRQSLERELGDARLAMLLMTDSNDVEAMNIHEWAVSKDKTIWQYLHHQEPK
jgi:hypothetical protein